jgi:threonine dehydrogenase-like Zn-dependent dehydrogenase
MTSKGLFGRKYLDIQLREREITAPDEGRVIVKVRACGVCGTDTNFVRDWSGDYMALGHEIAAEVVEVGKGVSGLRPGDKVIVEDCTMCGTCDACKTGHPELCRNMYSLEGQPGMGQYLSVRFNSLVKFDGLDYVPASLTEPLAVSLTSVLNANIPLGGSVVVLGNGPLGLMSALLARARGAGFVAVTGLPPDTALTKARLEAAEKADMDMVIQAGRESVEEKIKGRFPNGVDRVIVSSPPQSILDALKVIKFGGLITFYGLHFGGKNVIPVDVNDLIFRKITLVPTFAEPAINFPASLALLRDGVVDSGALVTHTCPLAETQATLTGLLDGSLPAIKAVVVP